MYSKNDLLQRLEQVMPLIKEYHTNKEDIVQIFNAIYPQYQQWGNRMFNSTINHTISEYYGMKVFSTQGRPSNELDRQMKLYYKWLKAIFKGNDNLSSMISTIELEILLYELDSKLDSSEDIASKNNFVTTSQKNIFIENETFKLEGRSKLESFFNEYIIEIIRNPERYKALGIDFPSAVILHGAPGCGKTYAVNKLVEYLGWPSYRMEASSVASPYIHETSRKVAEVFENAISASPSVLIIDEMEAYLSIRDNASHQHNIEEMAEFLRRIPEAIENNVLIIAMTNKIDLIDTAVLRRGRFDYIINVDYASAEEIEPMLISSLKKIAIEEDLNVKLFAEKLSGKPLSDVAFFIKEGARIAARNGKEKLDNASLNFALDLTLSTEQEKTSNRMGFI